MFASTEDLDLYDKSTGLVSIWLELGAVATF